MEHLNCLVTPGMKQTLSSSYLVCQAVDMDAIYSSDPRLFPTGGLARLAMVRVPCFYRALACRHALPCSALITWWRVGRGIRTTPSFLAAHLGFALFFGCCSKCHKIGTLPISRTGRAAWWSVRPRLRCAAVQMPHRRAWPLTVQPSTRTAWVTDRALWRRPPPIRLTSWMQLREPSSQCQSRRRCRARHRRPTRRLLLLRRRNRNRLLGRRRVTLCGTLLRHRPWRMLGSSRPSRTSTASATFPVPQESRCLMAPSLSMSTYRSPWLPFLAHWTRVHRPRPNSNAWTPWTMLWATPTTSPLSSFLTVSVPANVPQRSLATPPFGLSV